MGNIVAARFQEQVQVDGAIAALTDAGIVREKMSSFYFNPPGQHNTYAIGGDRDDSPGAHETGEGVVKGASTGSAIGIAAGLTGVALFGPVGPAIGALVGAHVGGLVGGLSEMKEKGEGEKSTDEGSGRQNELAQRKSGMILAVSADDHGPEAVDFSALAYDKLVQMLQEFGGEDIELAQGDIVEGDWHDFDPLSVPKFISPPTTDRTS